MKEQRIKICSYDVLHNGRVKPSALQRYFQQIALDDIADRGATYPNMRAKSMVFVLTKLRIDFYEDILSGDELLLRTYPYKVEGVTFFRAFELWRGEKLLCNADSRWVLINYKTRTILRPSEFPYELPRSEPTSSFGAILRRISQTSVDAVAFRKVRLTEVDENCHLNNCVYSDYLLDHVPADIGNASLKALCILYEHEAYLDDEIELRYQRTAEGFSAVAWNNTLGKSCFQAIFALDFS